MFEFFINVSSFLTNLAGCSEQDCPTSALTPIAAAFATQGYFVQADLLWQLSFTNLGIWAIIVFIAAAVGGMISMVLGNPPRHYVWFFLGPALYVWLIDTTQEVSGVKWQIGTIDPSNQEESWRLAETGLRNSNITERLGITINADGPPGKKVKIATAFLFWDELISSTVNHLVSWTGINRQLSGNGSATNITDGPPGRLGKGIDDWSILSHQKWSMLENITAARFHHPEIRDAFVSFMSSECGDLFTKSINKPAYITATRLRGAALDPNTSLDDFSIFLKDGAPMRWNLTDKRVPFPRSLAKVFVGASNQPGQYFEFNPATQALKDKFKDATDITCSGYLYLIIQAFRWEAGHIYHQMLTQPSAATGGRTPLDVDQQLYSLFYGWDIKKSGQQVDMQELKKFAKNLTLVHLIRNELDLAPNIMTNRYNYAKESENYVDAYQKSTGAKSKFGELYAWARLLPYVQGLLLYGLAAIYPVACVLIIMPGWSKTIFTWMSFWAWAKLWDVGFALVMVLERSIWAMMGNSVNNAALNAAIAKMSDISDVNVTAASNVVANVTSASPDADSWGGALNLLDKSITYGMAMNYDLANGYYIYIMAALYFAVPAVMGQLVLSGRSGAGGVANAMIGDVSKAGGSKAGDGFVGQSTVALDGARAVGQQTSRAAFLRQSGLGEKALDFGNKAMESGLAQSRASQHGTGLQMRSSADEGALRGFSASTNVDRAAMGFGQAMIPGPGRAAGSGNGGAEVIGAGSQLWNNFLKSANYGSEVIGKGGLTALAIGEDLQTQAHLNTAANLRGQQAELGISAFGAGQRQSGYNAQGQRVSQQAQFGADMAAWDFSRKYGADKQGSASAIGVFATQLTPGAKPYSVEGFAAGGYLGDSAKSAFNFADPDSGGANGLFSQIGAAQRSLGQEVGADSMWAHHHQWSPKAVAGFSLDHTYKNNKGEYGYGALRGSETGDQVRASGGVAEHLNTRSDRDRTSLAPGPSLETGPKATLFQEK